jgi:hypothetical protein
MQGNRGGLSQRKRVNASAMAEEDAWETVNLPRGFVFFRRICICYEDLYLLRGLNWSVCLFTGFVFVYELAGARSLFEEGGSVAGPEREL